VRNKPAVQASEGNCDLSTAMLGADWESEVWKLLLDQMKPAEAAQASNPGQALAPAIRGRFQCLTERRYESVQLTAQWPRVRLTGSRPIQGFALV
jgi:hypothetical protein